MEHSPQREQSYAPDGRRRPEVLGAGRVDIHERAFRLALRILKVVDALPRTQSGRTISQQLTRSGTSIGANVEEAQGAHSRAEFARRMGIARSEARETVCWLRLIVGHDLLPRRRLAAIRQETEEVARILTAIVKNARKPGTSQSRAGRGSAQRSSTSH
jgi:four helix bundle protein